MSVHPTVVDSASGMSLEEVGTTRTVNVNLAFTEGDLAVAIFHGRRDGPGHTETTPTAPAGWTLFAELANPSPFGAATVHSVIFYRVMPASPPSSHQFQWAGTELVSSSRLIVGIYRIQGHRVGDLFDGGGITEGGSSGIEYNQQHPNGLMLAAWSTGSTTEPTNVQPTFLGLLWSQAGALPPSQGLFGYAGPRDASGPTGSISADGISRTFTLGVKPSHVVQDVSSHVRQILGNAPTVVIVSRLVVAAAQQTVAAASRLGSSLSRAATAMMDAVMARGSVERQLHCSASASIGHVMVSLARSVRCAATTHARFVSTRATRSFAQFQAVATHAGHVLADAMASTVANLRFAGSHVASIVADASRSVIVTRPGVMWVGSIRGAANRTRTQFLETFAHVARVAARASWTQSLFRVASLHVARIMANRIVPMDKDVHFKGTLHVHSDLDATLHRESTFDATQTVAVDLLGTTQQADHFEGRVEQEVVLEARI